MLCVVDGPNGRHVDTDTVTLQYRLEELASTLCTYGEYLTSNAQRSGYVERLMLHVGKYAPADTMVPLELITSVFNKSEHEEHRLALLGKPIELTNSSVYLDVAPANIMRLKDDVLLKARRLEELENLLDKKNTE